MRQMFRPSGGVLYHLRALRSRTRWRTFTDDLEKWLFNWRKPGGTLLLVGPSGGYTLSTKWLRGFDEIHAFDIDPLAAWFFGMRHPGVHAHFHRQDLFWRDGRLSTLAVESALQAHPKASVLFCNVLGQLPLENRIPDGDMERYLKQLRASLQGSTWASYHDLYTVEPLPAANHEKVERAFRVGADITAGVAGVPRLEIVDHTLAGDWGKGLQSERLSWPLTSRSLHLIEALKN
ncbi:MAG: hypothetical protein ACXVA9_14025 [Bdellovibrionales bacterium]